MTTYARGPSTLKGALVSLPEGGGKPKVIAFQYNPATLRRSLQPELVGGEEGDRSQAVRFKGAPVQTIEVEIEIDATDALEQGGATALEFGIQPQLAALELLVYPTTSEIQQKQSLLASGAIEVAPLTAPQTIFVWGAKRVLPVRLTSYSVTEEAFDTGLNPIRATVTIGMRVLNYSDLSTSNPAYSRFMAYQRRLEAMETKAYTKNPKGVIGVQIS